MNSLIRQMFFSRLPEPLLVINKKMEVVYKNSLSDSLHALPVFIDNNSKGVLLFNTGLLHSAEYVRLLEFMQNSSNKNVTNSITLGLSDYGYFIRVFQTLLNEYVLLFIQIKQDLPYYKAYLDLHDTDNDIVPGPDTVTRAEVMMSIFTKAVSDIVRVNTFEDMYSSLDECLKGLWGNYSMDILLRELNDYSVVYSRNSITGSRYSFSDADLSVFSEMWKGSEHPLFLAVSDKIRKLFIGVRKESFDDLDCLLVVPVRRQESVVFLLILGLDSSRKGSSIETAVTEGISSFAYAVHEKLDAGLRHDEMKQNFMRHEKLTALGSIVAGVAHEINNPLSIMHLDVNELKELVLEKNSTIDAVFNSLEEEMGRIKNLLRQLRDYVNPDPAGTAIHEYTDVTEVIRSYPIQIVIKSYRKMGINVKMNLAAKKSYTTISANSLIQLMMNLLTNARDAVSLNPGDKYIYIDISEQEDEGEGCFINLTVRDNGCGISDANLQRVFDPFFSTKKTIGTGLGLSICYSIVKQSGADVHIESEEGMGTAVKIQFIKNQR